MILINKKQLYIVFLLLFMQILTTPIIFAQNPKILFPYLKKGKYGLLDSKGYLVVDYIYDFISPFKEGVAIVGINDKYGLVNYLGEETVIPQFDSIQYCFPNLYIVTNGDSSNIIDTLGNTHLSKWYVNIYEGWDQIFLLAKSSGNKLDEIRKTIKRYNLQDTIGLHKDSILFGNYLYGYYSMKHPNLNEIWFTGGTPFLFGNADVSISKFTFSIDTTAEITSRESRICDPTLRSVFIPDEPALFPGGNEALKKYLKENLKYPEDVASWYHNVIIKIKICITEAGHVNAKIIKPLHPDYDYKILEPFLQMPEWTPAKYKGIPVCSCFVYTPHLYLRGYEKH